LGNVDTVDIPMKTLAALLLALLVPATAGADVAFPGQRPAIDGRLVAEIHVAVQFWADRGVTGCPTGITAYYADDLAASDQAHADGRGNDCTIWLLSGYVDGQRADLSQPGHAREDAATECSLVAHEVGHALGLAHTTSGVMSATAVATPYACKAWARKAFPARRMKRPTHYAWVR
jgi:hypothetical protein